MATITVHGSGQLKAAVRNATAEVRAAVARAVEEEADAIVDDARFFVRVDTGDLSDSITARVDGVSAWVGPDEARSQVSPKRLAIKANVNEFGSSLVPEQPFMGQAAGLARRRFPARVERAIKAAVDG